MELMQMREKLSGMLLEKRFRHSVLVMETAEHMARQYGADVEKAKIAGLLHDCAKNFTVEQMLDKCSQYGIVLDDVARQQTGLIHGFLGAAMLQDTFGVDDPEIYDAVYYHTVGKPGMPLLTKIIYIADGIEPSRAFDGVDRVRELAQTDLDRALVLQIDLTIRSVLSKGTLLHTNTVDTRNYYLRKIR